MRRFEYRITHLGMVNTDALNSLGSEGWELVGVENDVTGVHRFFWKREIIDVS